MTYKRARTHTHTHVQTHTQTNRRLSVERWNLEWEPLTTRKNHAPFIDRRKNKRTDFHFNNSAAPAS